jgi:hypothetical protein
MKKKFPYLIILLFVLWFLFNQFNITSAEDQVQRIKFQVTVVAENSNKSEIITQSYIEGLPGTDFSINLNTENFKMQTHFLSDLVSPDKLKLRIKLETKRFYGMSPIDLPLYEEDKQNHTLNVGFDEKVVLLPFGRNGSSETLKIEITPVLFSIPNSNPDAEILKINFEKMKNSEIKINATKIPHNFEGEMILLADGKEIARGKDNFLLKEEKQITLIPNQNAPEEIKNMSIKTSLVIDEFMRSRPKDLASFAFDVFSANAQNNGKKTSYVNGRGVLQIGGEFTYQLTDLPQGKDYKIIFRVNLDKNEK